jgi:phosphate transport system protein
MSIKKDDAIHKILTDFESFANLLLNQLDLLETIISSEDKDWPKDVEKKILANEDELDKMEVKISDKIIHTIVLHKPVASEIRKVMACYRIIINLERVGDMVVSILKHVQRLHQVPVYADLNDVITTMLMQSTSMVNKALLAFTNDDRQYAVWTIKNDAVVNEINQKMLKKAIKQSSQSKEDKQVLVNFLSVNEMINSIKRIADHATNIGEAAIYSIEGKDVRHKNGIE